MKDVFGDRVDIPRCQWHKRGNVLSYLTEGEQPAWRRKLQASYEQPTYADAKRTLDKIHRELFLRNQSAANSLAEGLEETLTLHWLVVFPELGTTFKTTNLIENVMARVDRKTKRVGRWRTTDQKLRWCATALIDVEKNFRRVKAYKKLHLPKAALQTKIKARTRDAA